MRRAGYETDFVRDGNGRFIGINLKGDYCSEHEWGIGGIQDAFGTRGAKVTRECLGIDRRTITKVPNDMWFFFQKHGEYGYLMYTHPRYGKPEEKYTKKELDQKLGAYSDDKPIVAAWDEKEFGIRVKGKDNIVTLKSLYDAIQAKDAVIFLGGRSKNPFDTSGLVISFRSRIPEEFVKLQYDTDLETVELAEAKEATGIEEVLRKAGKTFYALSPRFQEDRSLVFWLNPMQQDKNNCGWFTVQDLQEWAQGTGKIPKSDEQLKREAEQREKDRLAERSRKRY